MTTEPWVSVEDVAKHLAVARDSVYRWIETRSLTAQEIGRLWKGFWVLVVPNVIYNRQPRFNEGAALCALPGGAA